MFKAVILMQLRVMMYIESKKSVIFVLVICTYTDIQSKSFFRQILSGLAPFKDIQCNSKLVNIYSKF